MTRLSFLTRRRLLALGAAGLASLAGCAELDPRDNNPNDNRPNNTPDDNDDQDDGPTNQPPESPAATIHRKDGERTYSFHDLFEYDGWTEDEDFSDRPHHPDSRTVHVEMAADAITVTVESMRLNRDIDLTVHYDARDGTIESTSRTVSPESDGFQTYEWRFDGPLADRPLMSKGRVEVAVQDSHLGDNAKRTLKSHRYFAIPYENADGSDVHYINDQGLNYIISSEGSAPPRRLHTEYFDTDADRTRFYVMPTSDPDADYEQYLLAGYTTISANDYEEYQNGKNDTEYWESNHPATYMYNAADIDHLNTLAETFAQSLDNAGITNHFRRLQVLAHLVGSMKYESRKATGRAQYPQFVSLHDNRGNCSEYTFLYLSLMNTPAFDTTRGAYISCEMGDLGLHAVVGIDERDLGTPPGEHGMYWVEPRQDRTDDGFPDTRYAFLEVTVPNRIGHRTPQVTKIYGVADTTDLHGDPGLREF